MTSSKMFEYMPWRITQRFPDLDAPENFNGPFDMVYPWQAVLKVNPMNSLANIYRELVTNGHNTNRFPTGETPYSPEHFNAPDNAPDWAAYFRKFRSFRDRIITWWRHHQRSDGQAGGGWNDDTLVFSSRAPEAGDAQIDMKDTTVKLKDGGSNSITVTVGEGNLTYTERRNIDYTLDRGNLDEVREWDQVPVEVRMDFTWLYILGPSSASTTWP